MLNKELAKVRGISPDVQDMIQKLQEEREILRLEMGRKQDAEQKVKDSLMKRFREIEIELQKLWEFPDSSYHRFLSELSIPGCLCPYLDNKDSGGIRRIINKKCKWHK